MQELFIGIFSLGLVVFMGVAVFWCFHKLFGQYAVEKKTK